MKNNKLAVPAGNGTTEQIAVRSDFGTVFVRRTDEGMILRPVKANMTLHEKAKQIYKVGNDYSISAAGYIYLNKTASISIVTPPTVSVSGINQPNPYVERNPKTKMIETVNVRKIGIGYSPIGNITVIDRTLFYNIYTYLIQSIQAKMNRKVWDNKANQYTTEPAYPNAARIGTRMNKPEVSETAQWAFFETASPLGIWANYLDPAIQECLDEHTQRQKFGDRMAQTIVQRNILADHPAIGVRSVDYIPGESKKTGRAVVTVYGYRHELMPEDLDSIQDQAARGAGTITISRDEIKEVPIEEEKDALEHETEDEIKPRPGEEEPPDNWKPGGTK